jgi:hypothetical protein
MFRPSGALEIASAVLIGERRKAASPGAIRHSAPLATHDIKLKKAAKVAGVVLFAA